MIKKEGVFLLKVLLFSTPLLALLLVYVVTDPFKVLRTYHFDNYYEWQRWELNRELAGVSNLKDRIAQNDTPDSYIFGNSRSFSFHCGRWESFFSDGSHAFHFDAANESLFGFCGKVKFLDRHKIKIKNALLVCDVRRGCDTQPPCVVLRSRRKRKIPPPCVWRGDFRSCSG